jgi:hypothetical protein
MNGRSSTTTGWTSRISREVAGALRRALPWALLAGLLGALVAGGGAAAVSAATPVRYVAAAEFKLIARDPNIAALSVNRGLLAEQVVRSLEESRADDYAAEAAPAGEFDGEWVTGPGFGELSYRVTSDDPDVATAAAQSVYDNAGFLGFDLVETGQPQSALDLLGVAKAAPDRKSATTTIGAAAVLGGFASFALVLLFAVPARRPVTAPADRPAPA